MKRVVFGVIATFAIFIAVAGTKMAFSQGKNLVQNAGAEQGEEGAPASWGKAVFPSAMSLDGVDYIWHSSIAHSGKRSLCFKKTENRFFPVAQWSQSVPYTSAARQVKVGVWIKTREAKKTTLTVSCVGKDGQNLSREFIAQVNDNGAPITQNWKRYDATMAVPAGTTELLVTPEMYGPGVAWFDDISIVPAS